MVVKGIISAIYRDENKASVILPEHNQAVTKPLKIYGKAGASLKVNDFVLVNTFNDDFNDAVILSKWHEASEVSLEPITNLELDKICV